MIEQSAARPEIIVAEDAEGLARRAADMFVEAAREPASPLGMFTVALSGGSTPRALYGVLASEPYRTQVPWDRTQVFFSDERFVPPDSPESNYHSAQETLLSLVPIPERFVHRVTTENVSPDEAASIYEEGIRRVLQAPLDATPAFDLILLGLGPDGHTASLFPGTAGLDVTDRLVTANHVDKLDSWRISFTYPLINAARRVVFLVEGEAKAEMVAQALSGGEIPAARVHPQSGRLTWLLDSGAAGRIPDDFRAS